MIMKHTFIALLLMPLAALHAADEPTKNRRVATTAGSNELEIEVTNVWANRLIGDEQEPPDCEWVPGHHFANQGGYLKRFPDWFVKKEPRSSKGRFCFTTWNYFTKDSPLIPSGLLGPVTISTTK